MFLDKQEWPHKINAMTYYEGLDMLSVGLNNGSIITYTFEIESFVHSGGSTEADSACGARLSPSGGNSGHGTSG